MTVKLATPVNAQERIANPQSQMCTTVWISGDQLSPRWPEWLAQKGLNPGNTRLLFIESAAKIRSRPWHKHKLILVLSAMRHFAEAMRRDGWTVDYRKAATFEAGLRAHVAAHAPKHVVVMQPNTWQGRTFVERLRATDVPIAQLSILESRFFLAKPEDLGASRSPLMETFYRKMRRRTGYLMDGDRPVGGKWNFDDENRHPPPRAWRVARAALQFPVAPTFPPDAMTREVIAEVAQVETAWGALDGFALPVTRADALAYFADFIAHRLPNFGPYEDAMVSGQPLLFHSMLSPLINIGLLERDELCAAAERAYREGRAPLNSVEGFIRQLIGWREFVYACYWREMPELREMNALGAMRPLPKFYWDGQTDMACLRECVQGVWERGYTHHIQRLMVLSNFALIAGVRPQEVNEWFFATYADAYDWVVTPNVVGMGTYGDGGIVGTKPYAASANYIHKMSTYCEGCRYDPKQRVGERACPFNALYWDFVARHADVLGANPRTSMPVMALRRMSTDEVKAIRAQAARFLDSLS
ncbi:MAG: cryptochrome/photolyase family protein [Thermoflexales bacterium]|nr:cryptochrome/photolyase family protein [Thermoflexales bacterium]